MNGAPEESAAPSDETAVDLGFIEEAWRVNSNAPLALHIAMVGKLIDRHVARLLARHCGLNVAQWRCVALLQLAGISSHRDLSRQAWVDRGEVSRALATLERRGLVRRRANPADGRSPHFMLTEAGDRLYADFVPHWRNFQEELMAALPHSQIAATDAALERLARTCLDLLDETDR